MIINNDFLIKKENTAISNSVSKSAKEIVEKYNNKDIEILNCGCGKLRN